MGVYDNNPYLPPFAANRPRIEPPRQIQTPQISIPGSLNYSQIQPVSGFDGARAFANGLAIGSSAIIAESDPNIARVYIVAKDANGQSIVEGYKLIPDEEPKPKTMDDLSAQMSEIISRLNKLEEDQNAKPLSDTSRKNAGATSTTVAKPQPTANSNPANTPK